MFDYYYLIADLADTIKYHNQQYYEGADGSLTGVKSASGA
jgi:hypothetical protein